MFTGLFIPLAEQFAPVQQQLSPAVLAGQVIPIRVVGFVPFRWVELQGWVALSQESSEAMTHFQNFQEGCLLNTSLHAPEAVSVPGVHELAEEKLNALFLFKVTVPQSKKEEFLLNLDWIVEMCRAQAIRKLTPEDAMKVFGQAMPGESDYYVVYTHCDSLEEGRRILHSLSFVFFTEVIALIEEGR